MPKPTIVEVAGTFTADQFIRIENILTARSDYDESSAQISQIVIESFGEIGEEEATKLQDRAITKVVCQACNCKTGVKSCTRYAWSGKGDVWIPTGVVLKPCDAGEC
jgi:hypothetical protein